MMDKRAISDGMVNFFQYVGIISLIIILFTLGIRMSGDAIILSMESKSAMSEHHHTLMAFLRYPVEVDGQTMPMSDVIGLATVNSDYQFIAIQQGGRFFRHELYRDLPTMEIGVEFPVGSGLHHSGSFYINPFIHTKKIRIAETLIPNRDGELINITLVMKEGVS